MTWAVLVVHICGAAIGLIAGYMAMLLRKGSSLHRLAGGIFVISMLTMAVAGAYVALVQSHAFNALNTMLTFYLVATGALAARRRDGGTGWIDRAALLLVAGVAAGLVFYGAKAAGQEGGGAPVYFVFAAVALLHAASDVRMLIRGGVSGGRRIARHLWRMSLALFFATMSLYPGNAKLFPEAWRETNLLFVPHVLLAGAVLFALVRVRRTAHGAAVAAAKRDPSRTISSNRKSMSSSWVRKFTMQMRRA